MHDRYGTALKILLLNPLFLKNVFRKEILEILQPGPLIMLQSYPFSLISQSSPLTYQLKNKKSPSWAAVGMGYTQDLPAGDQDLLFFSSYVL